MEDADYLIGRSEMKHEITEFIEAMAAATLLSEKDESKEKDTFYENRKAIYTTLKSLANALEKSVPIKPEKQEKEN